MARHDLNAVVRYLQQFAGSPGASGASDAELLERYVRCRDETAFELLLWRHGALVLNVCRRLLACPQDAEDAFQATFLAFVRKAGSISRRSSVAAWLYKVAYRVALEARERARKTAAMEKAGGEALAVQHAADPLWSDVRPILDEELNRLPERLRQPIVLCYLEGKSNQEAARQLGCPAGTIYSRLARGREILRRRLERRGVTLSVAVLTAALTEHAVEAMPAATLMATTLQSALLFAARKSASGVSASAAALAEGVLRTMFVTKLKLTALIVLTAGLFAVSGVLARHTRNADPQAEEPKEKPVVSVVRPTPGGLQRSRQVGGYVDAVAQQQVYPVVSGNLKRLAVDLGDKVKKGDVLVEIESLSLEMEYKQAELALRLETLQVAAAQAQVETAAAEVKATLDRLRGYEAKLKSDEAYADYRKKQAERYRGLQKDRAIPQTLVDEQEDQLRAAIGAVNATRLALQGARSDVGVRESKVQSAKVALEMARTKMEMARLVEAKARAQRDFAVLRANFDGVVGSRNVNTGDFVFASDQGGRKPLLTVLRTDPTRVRVNVAENDAPFIHPGSAVHLDAAALPDAKLPGCTVSRTGFAIDANRATMPVEIDVPNPKNLLRPGMSVTATIVLDKKAPAGAVTVPESSVVRLKEQSYVYVVRDDKAHLTPVRATYQDGDKMEIASGLRAADRIVVDPRGLKGEVIAVGVKSK